MGMITSSPHIAPVPRDVHHVRLGADPGFQGQDSITVRVAMHTTNTPNWPVKNITLSTDKPRIDVELGNTDILSMTVTGGFEVGYAFI